LQEYAIQNRLVTNREYLEFMEAGGYENFAYWLSEGWEWAKQLEIKAPLYWYKEHGDWQQYTLGGMQAIDPTLPVTHISYFEADAYAQWRGLRLPTEMEWEVACNQLYSEIPRDSNWLESGQFHPSAQKQADDYQMLGHVWEWTGSAYLPYPNYPRLKGALGEYNGKFMINQMVLRGGSCATPITHIRPTYRNFFQTDKRWQFTGFRLAR
jgi:ergothioneine biosynthesis protein EgtB